MPDLTLLIPTEIGFYPPSTVERRVTFQVTADCVAHGGEPRYTLPRRDTSRVLSFDTRQRSEAVALRQVYGAAAHAVPTGDSTAGLRMVSKVPSSVQRSTSV